MPTEQDKLEFAQRLNSIFDENREAMKGRARKLEKITGLSNTAAQKWLKGESIPRRDPLRRIANEYGKSLEWLEYGVVHRTESSVTYSVKGEDKSQSYVDIEFFSVDAEESSIREISLMDSVPFKRSFLDGLGIKPEDCCVINQSGSNMEPAINDNDQMLINRRDRELKDQGIYVFRVSDSNYTYQVSSNVDGSITLVSQNNDPSYPDQKLPKNETLAIEIVGRVVWSGGKK